MSDELERLIRLGLKRQKSDLALNLTSHPDEETVLCFLGQSLGAEESEEFKRHILSCPDCAEKLALSLNIQESTAEEVPEELILKAKELVKDMHGLTMLEIFIKFKDDLLEIINTTGDVLVGQELMPAPVLRSRSIKDFKDEVLIFKDFQAVRVEAKIENKKHKFFNLSIVVRDKQTQRIMKDLRLTLFKEDIELESYLSDSGTVIFEHVLLGRYMLEITSLNEKLASVLLDIKN